MVEGTWAKETFYYKIILLLQYDEHEYLKYFSSLSITNRIHYYFCFLIEPIIDLRHLISHYGMKTTTKINRCFFTTCIVILYQIRCILFHT